MDSYPYLEPGDPVTLDTTLGHQGLTGEVVAVDLNEDGTIRCLSLREPSRPDPLRIRGDLIALWRKGEPVRRQVQQGIAVPAGLPPGLLGPNGGRG